MIPDIGVLIAAYVFTRLFDLLLRPFPREPIALQLAHFVVKACALIGMAVAVIVGVDLVLRGTTGVSLPELK